MWYVGNPEDAQSVLYDPSLRFALNQSLKLAVLTMLVATPIGVALAIGLARWRGRGARASNFLMLIPLVTPEIVMGVALFLVLTLAGGNDVLATILSVPVEGLTMLFRVLLVVAPVVTWIVVYKLARDLRARNAELGPASVLLVRTPDGGFTEAER